MKPEIKRAAVMAVAILMALIVTSCSTPTRKDAYLGHWRKLPNDGLITITDAGDHLTVVGAGGQELTGRMQRHGVLRVYGFMSGIPVDMSIDKVSGHIIWGNREYEKTKK